MSILLSACATMSEKDCYNADWNKIGFRDGESGYPLSRLHNHAEACSEYGIEPDETAYRTARDRGLRRYCTPEKGLEVGKWGGGYGNVCPAELEGAFLRGYTLGRDIHWARSEVKSLEQERSSLENRLAHAKDDDERRRLQNQLFWVRSRQQRAFDELQFRESRAWMELR